MKGAPGGDLKSNRRQSVAIYRAARCLHKPQKQKFQQREMRGTDEFTHLN